MNTPFRFIACFLFLASASVAQTPELSSWLINTNGAKGRHYVNGNSTPIQDNDSVNVQRVQYSTNWVYVKTKGIPAYITGPFLDGNPSQATNQNAIFKLSRNPVQNIGTPTNTTGGNIGICINGVAIFDYRDGVAWNATTNALCGGPGNPPCPGGPMASLPWNRDAIRAERPGFDCSKGHPAMGNYHHHQNPSAFNLDLNVLSTICNLYAADGLYTIDSTQHSPLIGYAYDGFPIYGAYGYRNTDGTGGIVRIKSGYALRSITVRTTSPTGATVTAGPPVSTTYPLGYFREDYYYVGANGMPDVLDVHNGRFCVTPEYPNGTYCYFATVDANWNSAYPYLIGPTFYGTVTGAKVTSINETVTTFAPSPTGLASEVSHQVDFNAYPNPGSEFLSVQVSGLNRDALQLYLYDITGRLVEQKSISPGSTIAYFDVRTLYPGQYLVKLAGPSGERSKRISITR